MSKNLGALKLKQLTEEFSVCTVKDYEQVNFNRPFVFIGVTDQENSLVCETAHVPDNTLEREDGWLAFRVQGVLEFSLVGILSKLSTVLAEEGIGIFAISTFQTDYSLTKTVDFEKALSALKRAGYLVE